MVLNADDPGCRELAVLLPGDVDRLVWLRGRPWLAATADRRLDPARRGAAHARGRRAAPRPPHARNVLAAALGAPRWPGAERPAIAAGVRGFARRPAPHRDHRGAPAACAGSTTRRPRSRWRPSPPGGVRAGAGGADRRRQGQGAGLRRPLPTRSRDTLPRRDPDRRDGGRARATDRRRVPVVRRRQRHGARPWIGAAAEAQRRRRGAAGSPAAASFDMFADYAARGDAFRRAVAAPSDAAGASGA